MPSALPRSELVVRLLSLAESQGNSVSTDGDVVGGTREAISANWFLGGRKVVYTFSVRLDEAAHEARLREAATERSWGIPPPTFTVEKSSQRETRVFQSRTDTGVGGGGTLEYGRLRELIEQAVHDGGWQFVFDVGKQP